ncbi:MAG TPA: hypothetical protein VJN21_05170 [Candidatus Acidoferrales bacterium]|nr:hypothetical protein [Candidatus Acidoferrales bacterium]
MPGPISAVDSVSPAFADTRRMLFAPWKFGMWWRMSVLGLLTGEFASGGFSGSPNFRFPQQNRRLLASLVPLHSEIPDWVRQNWIWLALCGILLVALFCIAEYLASVSRFVLLDAVVSGRCEIRAQWRKWRRQGVRYFFWDIGFALACVVVLLLLIGIPLWSFIKKIPSGANPNWGALLAGGLLVFLGVAVFLVLVGVVDLFARDFLIPVMAMENCGVWAGWRRVKQLLGGERLACTGYVLMKIVLAMGSAILFGVVDLVVLLLLLIPIGLVAIATYFIFLRMNLTWSVGTVSGVCIEVALAIAVISWACAFVYSPGLVFFQSYALRFFASRFPALDAAMNPAPQTPAGFIPSGPLPQPPFSSSP